MIHSWLYCSSSKKCSIHIWCVCSEFWAVGHWLSHGLWLVVSDKYRCCGPCVVQLMWSLFLSTNLIITVCCYICRVCYRVSLTSRFVVLWINGAASNVTVFVYVLCVLHLCTWMHVHFVLLHRCTVCNILAVNMFSLFSHFCRWIALFANRYLQFPEKIMTK